MAELLADGNVEKTAVSYQLEPLVASAEFRCPTRFGPVLPL